MYYTPKFQQLKYTKPNIHFKSHIPLTFEQINEWASRYVYTMTVGSDLFWGITTFYHLS